MAARLLKRDVIAHAAMAKTTMMAARERPMPRPRPSCCWLLRTNVGAGTGEYVAALKLATEPTTTARGDPMAACHAAAEAKPHSGAQAAVVSGNAEAGAVSTTWAMAAAPAADVPTPRLRLTVDQGAVAVLCKWRRSAADGGGSPAPPSLVRARAEGQAMAAFAAAMAAVRMACVELAFS